MRKTLWLTVLVGLLLLGVSVSALAKGISGPGNPPANQDLPQGPQRPGPIQADQREEWKAALGVLVIDGVIKREQALTILKYFEQHGRAAGPGMKEDPAGHPQGFFAPLVEKRVINQEQAGAIEKILARWVPMPGNPEEPGKPGGPPFNNNK